MCGVPRHAAAQHAWYELVGAFMLNLAFSPLMAFALYFGFYHAPVHIWRVWRSRPRGKLVSSFGLLHFAATLLITLILGAALFSVLEKSASMFSMEAAGLRWLVVALAALTLPHLVLVSLCARQLSQPAHAD